MRSSVGEVAVLFPRGRFRWVENGHLGREQPSRTSARPGAVVHLRREIEAAAKAGMHDAGLDVPFSAEGWASAHLQAAEALARLEGDADALREARFDAFEAHATAKRELARAREELVAMSQSKSLLPQDAVENRAAIAEALGVAEDEMPFGGELIDLAEEAECWRPAAERALRSLATTLLVPGERFAAVTRWLDANPVRGAVRAVDLSSRVPGAGPALEAVGERDLLAKLDILDSGEHADAGRYVRERIAVDFAYVCVEDPDELEGLERGLSLGGVVKRGRGTVENDDRFAARGDYVLGFDNASKVEYLAARILDLESSLTAAAEAAQACEDSQQADQPFGPHRGAARRDGLQSGGSGVVGELRRYRAALTGRSAEGWPGCLGRAGRARAPRGPGFPHQGPVGATSSKLGDWLATVGPRLRWAPDPLGGTPHAQV